MNKYVTHISPGSREDCVPHCRQETVVTAKPRTTPTLSDSGYVESHTPDNAMCKCWKLCLRLFILCVFLGNSSLKLKMTVEISLL